MEGLQAVTVFFKDDKFKVIEKVEENGISWGKTVLTLTSEGCVNQFPIEAVKRILARSQKDYADDIARINKNRLSFYGLKA